MRDLTQETLQRVFDYKDGELIWKVRTGPRSIVGKVAGSIDSYGYRQISLFGIKHLAHKLVWLWHGKQIEEGLEFDHVNRNRKDNRIENLRLLTHAENINVSTLKEYAKKRKRVNHRWIKENL